jgi:hypothetical protein
MNIQIWELNIQIWDLNSKKHDFYCSSIVFGFEPVAMGTLRS